LERDFAVGPEEPELAMCEGAETQARPASFAAKSLGANEDFLRLSSCPIVFDYCNVPESAKFLGLTFARVPVPVVSA
jgi:hypothetical protein